MKKYIFMFAMAGLGLSVFAAAPSKKIKKSTEVSYKVDVAASTFKWHAKKVTGAHSGTVNFGSGTISFLNNLLAKAVIIMDMKTIEVTDLTGEYHDKLVNHLKGEDFFSVQKYNTAVLTVKSASPIAGAAAGSENYTIVADLTIKGITKEVLFSAMISVNAKQVIVNADFDIDRTDFDIRYSSGKFFEGLGDKAIMDKFNIKVRVVANK